MLEFYDYYQAGATGAGGVLLQYGDESPAMASLHHGLGTVLLLNFSAGEFSSNLARQRIFPAWMQDLVKTLATAEPPPSSYTVGEPLQAEVWRSEMHDEVISPAGIAVMDLDTHTAAPKRFDVPRLLLHRIGAGGQFPTENLLTETAVNLV